MASIDTWNALRQPAERSCENCTRPGFYGPKYNRTWVKPLPLYTHQYPRKFDEGNVFCKICDNSMKEGLGRSKWKWKRE